ncbi:MaoC family dehydratase [Halobium palmae]|uniref:MaoC family dehydratase n=1 Tax=Halobium palmae TaxID=1776492 RepID=A0ABD5RWR9_9EURY
MTDAYESPPEPRTLAVGDVGPTVVVEDLSRRDVVKYAGASGDFNPIHYDEPLTREAGNPEVFAQGMLTMGFASHVVADWFGIGNVERFQSRFQSRVFPGDTITVSGTVTDVSEGGERVEADIEAVNQDGTTVLTGDVTAVLSAE